MANSLLSLKWNNHKIAFFQVLSNLRIKETYCDVTLACDGKFYPLHKLILSTCSEYFEEMFERTTCKNPVIVLKDIKCEELEALLNYMYIGEVNVLQENLAGLIKAAECLRIKGLAVPDENIDEPVKRTQSLKRNERNCESPRAKKRRKESVSDLDESMNSSRMYKNVTKDNTNSQQISNSEVSPNVRDSSESSNSDVNSTEKTNNSINKCEQQTEYTYDEVKQEPYDADDPIHSIEKDSKASIMSNMTYPDQYLDSSALLAEDEHLDSIEDFVKGDNSLQQNSFPPWIDGDAAEGASGSGLPHQMVLPDLPFSIPRVLLTSESESPNKDGTHGEGILRCHICGRVFLHTWNYRRHFRTHTKEKPFQCSFCPFRFSRKDNLTRHLVLKHKSESIL